MFALVLHRRCRCDCGIFMYVHKFNSIPRTHTTKKLQPQKNLISMDRSSSARARDFAAFINFQIGCTQAYAAIEKTISSLNTVQTGEQCTNTHTETKKTRVEKILGWRFQSVHHFSSLHLIFDQMKIKHIQTNEQKLNCLLISFVHYIPHS